MARDETSRSVGGRDGAQALRWLREVDGRLLRKRQDPPGPDGWVAVVRAPAATGQRAALILGFGDSAREAVETAQESWDRVWREQPVN